MTLPIDLQTAINQQLVGISQTEIAGEAKNISLRYRGDIASEKYIDTRMGALAYAVTRMPATYSAVYKALFYALECMKPNPSPISLLDVGAGTGTVLWAANELLNVDSIVCLERSKEMISLGEALAKSSDNILSNIVWKNTNILTDTIENRSDYVVASYIFNEIETDSQTKIMRKLWEATKVMLLIVEPGTKEGYMNLMRLRSTLLEENAYIIAPCPHGENCPLPEDDWCHFTCRVERSRMHRLSKGGEAPYEDEKFSFLAFTREKTDLSGSRVLRHPYIGEGYIKLKLCSIAGLAEKTYTKRDKEKYKEARKVSSGDLFITT